MFNLILDFLFGGPEEPYDNHPDIPGGKGCRHNWVHESCCHRCSKCGTIRRHDFFSTTKGDMYYVYYPGKPGWFPPTIFDSDSEWLKTIKSNRPF